MLSNGDNAPAPRCCAAVATHACSCALNPTHPAPTNHKSTIFPPSHDAAWPVAKDHKEHNDCQYPTFRAHNLPRSASASRKRTLAITAFSVLALFLTLRTYLTMRWTLIPAVAVPLLTQAGHGYEVKTPPLDTDWTYKVGTDPWPEYPRPQLVRDDWLSLNGIWKWRAASGLGEAANPPVDEVLVDDVLVPSCLESALSGVMAQDVAYAWFTRNFSLPEDWAITSGRILLNFEAVDYEATVFINGKKAGFHRGGYWRFTIDATDFLETGDNTM